MSLLILSLIVTGITALYFLAKRFNQIYSFKRQKYLQELSERENEKQKIKEAKQKIREKRTREAAEAISKLTLEFVDKHKKP